MQPASIKKPHRRLKPHLRIWKKEKKDSIENTAIDALFQRRTTLASIDELSFHTFSQIPLSEETLKGLNSNSFLKPTLVQKRSLKHSLLGHDIIVEAKTGSGKTLAFVIPILECIFSEKITPLDGPVAIVLTPTRELARQIFNVFYQVGKFHKFTILDVMGGKTKSDKRDEWQRIAKANILIGTPGRIAQHQQENPTLGISNLRFLVLDEADRLLDPTFLHDLLIITDNLSTDRQTLLFSATLSRLSAQMDCLNLKSPIKISTNTSALPSTPSSLMQSYSVVPLEKKMDYLWTFLQSHCKKKIIVFFSTQKQVRFAHDLFLQLRPFFSVMQLRGNMIQSKRFKIYEKFSQSPRGCVLLATNIAERGLDFPEVHWVVQFDCPKQLDDYIHRVGRTARAEKIGRAITFLLPSEVRLVELLAKRNVVLREQSFPESRIKPFISNRAPILLASQPELAASARSAFIAYLRDYCFIPKSSAAPEHHSNSQLKVNMSEVFQPSLLPITEFAGSLGLPTTPEIPKALQQHIKLSHSNSIRETSNLRRKSLLEEINAAALWPASEADDSHVDGLIRRKTFSVLDANPHLKAKAQSKGCKLLAALDSDSPSSSEESDTESIAHAPVPTSASGLRKSALEKSTSRIKLAKKELKKNIHSHSKIEFDDDGNPIVKKVGGVAVTYTPSQYGDETVPPRCLDIKAERTKLKAVIDFEDKARWRQRVRDHHRLKRHKNKEARRETVQKSEPQLRLPEEEETADLSSAESGADNYDASSHSDESNSYVPPAKRVRTSN